MTTLKDVAKAVGVDASTVSRALSGDPRVSETTRIRIKAKAEELGYRPHEAARRLRMGSTRTVWVVASHLDNSLELVMIERCLERLASEGYYGLVALHRQRTAEEIQVIRQLDRGLADGAIIIPNCQGASAQFEELLRRRFPLVFLDRHPEDQPGPIVTTDNAAAVESLIAAAEGQGVREWIVDIDSPNPVARLRRETAIARLQALGRPWRRLHDSAPWTVPAEGRVGLLLERYQEPAQHPLVARIAPSRRVLAVFDAWDPTVLPARIGFVAEQDLFGMCDHGVTRLLNMLDGTAWSAETERLPIAALHRIEP